MRRGRAVSATKRARGLPLRAMMISSPCAARSTSSGSLALARAMLTAFAMISRSDQDGHLSVNEDGQHGQLNQPPRRFADPEVSHHSIDGARTADSRHVI